jgi:hypothetical protein
MRPERWGVAVVAVVTALGALGCGHSARPRGTTATGVDVLTGSNQNNGINSAIRKRMKRDQAALQRDPEDETALADLVRAHYQLATDDADADTGAFGAKGKQELAQASGAWKRYVAVADEPSDSLAGLMLQAYSEGGLNMPAEAAKAAEVVAAARPSAQAYLTLTAYAAQAGETRIADLAGQKAIELAPPGQKQLVRQQVRAATQG